MIATVGSYTQAANKLALASWLMVLSAIHCTDTLPAQDTTKPTVISEQQDAPRTKTAQTSLASINELLRKLDEHFVRGNIAAYVGEFAPDHPGSLAMLGHHLKRLCAVTGKDRKRTSEIIGEPTQFSNRTVVRVRHTINWPNNNWPNNNWPNNNWPNNNWPNKKAGVQGARRIVEDAYLAVRQDSDGKIVPTFAIEMPKKLDCVIEDKFRCPPCNYEIGGVAGFLCVPLRRERALALESASFYLIGTGVVCDVHVQIPSKPKSATATVRTLASAFAKLEPSAQVGIVTPWMPPTHQNSPPQGMDSARVIVELPDDQQADGGGVTIFHVVKLGGLQHVLLVRSSDASLRRHQQHVDKLFESYALLDVNCDKVALTTGSVRHHTGGTINNGSYRNIRYGVEMQGPRDWQTEHRVGGSMFRVRWTSPSGSQMWLIGHSVPTGMDQWTIRAADRWLGHHCEKNQLMPVVDSANSKEAEWHTNSNGSNSRTKVLRQTKPKSPNSPRRRILHAQLHDDLLLIVDGFGNTELEEAALRTALQTLKRN